MKSRTVYTGLLLVAALVMWTWATPRYYATLSVWVERPDPASPLQSGALPGRRPGELAVVVLDVGKGTAVLLQGPGNETSIIDGGPGQYPTRSDGPSGDAAHHVILPLLERFGIDRVRRMIGTVPVDHHVGAQADLLSHGQPVVDEVVLPPAGPGRAVWGRLNRLARRRETDTSVLSQTEAFEPVPGLVGRVLNPPRIVSTGPPQGHGLFLQYGQRRFVLMGDLDRTGERRLVLRWGKTLRADCLVVGRHGAEDATGRELLRYVRPRYAVVPTGRDPAVRVVRALRKYSGDTVYRTDRDGPVALFTDGETLRVRTRYPNNLPERPQPDAG